MKKPERKSTEARHEVQASMKESGVVGEMIVGMELYEALMKVMNCISAMPPDTRIKLLTKALKPDMVICTGLDEQQEKVIIDHLMKACLEIGA